MIEICNVELWDPVTTKEKATNLHGAFAVWRLSTGKMTRLESIGPRG